MEFVRRVVTQQNDLMIINDFMTYINVSNSTNPIYFQFTNEEPTEYMKFRISFIRNLMSWRELSFGVVNNAVFTAEWKTDFRRLLSILRRIFRLQEFMDRILSSRVLESALRNHSHHLGKHPCGTLAVYHTTNMTRFQMIETLQNFTQTNIKIIL